MHPGDRRQSRSALSVPADHPATPAAASWPRISPVDPNLQTISLDDQIGRSITRGVNFLLTQFQDGHLKGYSGLDSNTSAGLDALAVYALLQAGEATHDDRLGPHSPVVDKMLTVLKSFPMEQGRSTYARSLRATALAVYNRGEDRSALRADAAWLIRDSTDGAYTYSMPPKNRRRADNQWDNSNSQYGALGVWAALDAGVEVPTSYWRQVQHHWLDSQLPTGEWGYSPGTQNGRLSMTVAGITMLFVTQDQLETGEVPAHLGLPPFKPALARGLKWLETGDHSVTLPFDNHTYNLYGLERAALASGFKYFGTHDWYRELASGTLIRQMPDGAWGGGDPVVDTSFTLLFLSRGRHPIFMNKLRFDGFWANRPRDISNLTRFASAELERPLNWQVVSLASDWSDWMDSPILYIASHLPPKFTDDDYDKLRNYAENGGLIFTHADGDSDAFNRFVAQLCKRLFPNYPLHDLPLDHPIYSTLYNKLNPKPPLQGVSNGSRLLLLNSPTELNLSWQLRNDKVHPAMFQIGMNIFIYATGKVNLRNKLHTTLVPEPKVQPIATVPIACLSYPGNWNPEPAAWPRFSRQFLGETSIQLSLKPIDPRDLRLAVAPLAHLTGTTEVHFDPEQIKTIHDYVTAGGVLLIDACGGSPAFAQSIRDDLLPRAFPDQTLQSVPPDHPILSGSGDGSGQGMSPVTPRLRPYAANQLGSPDVPLQYLQPGHGAVFFCPEDITTALLGTNTYTVMGCEPDSAHDLTRNEILWTLERQP